MKIQVKAKHIKEGRPRQSRSCPIALACKDLGLDKVTVEDTCIHYYKGSHYIRMVLPKSAKEFVSRFDDGQPVKPFRFTTH